MYLGNIPMRSFAKGMLFPVTSTALLAHTFRCRRAANTGGGTGGDVCKSKGKTSEELRGPVLEKFDNIQRGPKDLGRK
jgi:hypothetical protein